MDLPGIHDTDPRSSKEILLDLGATIHKPSVLEAAEQLLEVIDKQHEKPYPLKYSIPYGAVNALRLAVDAEKNVLPNKTTEA